MLTIRHTREDGSVEEHQASHIAVDRFGKKHDGIRLYANPNASNASKHFKEGAGGIIAVVNEHGIEEDVYNI